MHLLLITAASICAVAAGGAPDPQADPLSIVTQGRLRVTVLTPSFVRVEVGSVSGESGAAVFDDRATFRIVNRRLPVPQFVVTTVNATTYDLDNTVFPTEGTLGGSGSAGAGTGLKGNDQLGRLTVSNVPGLRGDLDGDGDIDRILSYGGRSFSILDAEGRRVFDSGDVLDRIVAQYYPSLWDDTRSDNKSIEPEGVSVATLGGRSYAFIGLERAHAVFVFDVTDPAAVSFVTAVSRRGDLNPEGMLVVPAADSPNGQPLLLVASEVSFTLSVFSLVPASPAMQLQILHYYGESGLLGIQTAPIMGAMIDRFDNEYPTVVLGEGDSFIPGPWLTAGADPSLNAVPGIGRRRWRGLTLRS